MNVKKIMGAVLVALLAAALFTGAGAAANANPVQSGDTVFLYQNITNTSNLLTAGNWADLNGEKMITLVAYNGGYYFAPSDNFVAGMYLDPVNGTVLNIMAPAVMLIGNSGNSNVIGGTTYQNSIWLNSTTYNTNVAVSDYVITYPNGTVYQVTPTLVGSEYTYHAPNLPDGEYKVQAKFDEDAFASMVTPSSYKKSAVYTFTVIDATKVAISLNKDSLIVGDAVALTITGVPGEKFEVNLTNFNLTSVGTANGGQMPNDNKDFIIDVGSSGKETIYLKAVDDGNGKIKVEEVGDATNKASLTIQIGKGTITAATDKDSYYIGNIVKLSGTSTVDDAVYLYIEGTNKAFDVLNVNGDNEVSVKTNGEWEVEISGDVFEFGYDAGTYTVYVAGSELTADAQGVYDRSDIKDTTYTTVALVLKQPFISVTDAPTVAVKDTDYIVTGTAEAAENVYVYIFGTNFFAAGKDDIKINQNGKKIGTVDVEDDDVFTIELEIPDERDVMATGQYFMVIQHPMYNGDFNIAPVGQKIYLNETAPAGTSGKVLFEVNLRQTANAAQALCDALDTQNIDDLYVKLSFVVANGQSTINPIPSEITQGSKLTVSGSTNVGEGEVVTVEMLSTAFAAVPKETVGSASFISLVTTTDADGNWEVTFDTTGLNVDEYTVSVAVGQLGTTTTKINVIEGAPTEQPTENPTEQPTQTTEPTQTEAPSTPGFGALAALAGLGAVAVLLLRRE